MNKYVSLVCGLFLLDAPLSFSWFGFRRQRVQMLPEIGWLVVFCVEMNLIFGVGVEKLPNMDQVKFVEFLADQNFL